MAQTDRTLTAGHASADLWNVYQRVERWSRTSRGVIVVSWSNFDLLTTLAQQQVPDFMTLKKP